MKKTVIRILSALLLVGVTLAIFEAVLLFGLNHPQTVRRYLPENFSLHLKHLYLNYDRVVVQYEPGMGRWDSELFYTLEPGRFTFRNREFSTEYFVNSKGLRDTEDSLKGPEIIVLGDSVAMGWGVNQQETFSTILGKQLSTKVLNASVASYGTAREFLMLRRLDLSRLKTIILQYSNNDVYENESFVSKGFKYEAPDEQTYEAARGQWLKDRRYFFGRYSLITIKELVLRIAQILKIHSPDPNKAYSAENEAAYLVKTLKYFQNQGLSGIKIILITFSDNVDGFENASDKILPFVESEKLRNIQTLPINKKLDSSDHYYVLDGHLTAAGHEAVAKELFQLLTQARSAAR